MPRSLVQATTSRLRWGMVEITILKSNRDPLIIMWTHYRFYYLKINENRSGITYAPDCDVLRAGDGRARQSAVQRRSDRKWKFEMQITEVTNYAVIDLHINKMNMCVYTYTSMMYVCGCLTVSMSRVFGGGLGGPLPGGRTFLGTVNFNRRCVNRNCSSNLKVLG